MMPITKAPILTPRVRLVELARSGCRLVKKSKLSGSSGRTLAHAAQHLARLLDARPAAAPASARVHGDVDRAREAVAVDAGRRSAWRRATRDQHVVVVAAAERRDFFSSNTPITSNLRPSSSDGLADRVGEREQLLGQRVADDRDAARRLHVHRARGCGPARRSACCSPGTRACRRTIEMFGFGLDRPGTRRRAEVPQLGADEVDVGDVLADRLRPRRA